MLLKGVHKIAACSLVMVNNCYNVFLFKYLYTFLAMLRIRE